jgi:transcriptional regulator with XRE-family HTH domain
MTIRTAKTKGWLAREIGSQLRKHRKQQGLTLKQTTDAIIDPDPISLSMLGQVEKDGQNTTLDKLEGVLNVLGLEVRVEPSHPEHSERLLAAEPGPTPRASLTSRLGAVAPRVPNEDLEVLDRLLALWERRYG